MKTEKSNEKESSGSRERNYAADHIAEYWMKRCQNWMGNDQLFDRQSCWCFTDDDPVEKTKNYSSDGWSKRCGTWMKRGRKGGLWFFIFFLLILASTFLLTYFLAPETVKIIGLVIIGTFLGIGIVIMIMIKMWISGIKKKYSNS